MGNEGIVTNTAVSNNQNVQSDIQKAKIKLNELKKLNQDEKDYLCELLDEANGRKLKVGCVYKFKGFLGDIGKVSTEILGVLGSIASFLELHFSM